MFRVSRPLLSVLFLSVLAVLLIQAGPPDVAPEGLSEEAFEESADLVRLREEWFYGQRREMTKRSLGELGVARLRAWESVQAGLKAGTLRESLRAEQAWKPIGPTPILDRADPFYGPNAGRVRALALHPTDADVLFLGSAQGGVWKSGDRGRSWAPLTDQQCSPAISAVAVDPVNPQIVYAGTGEEYARQGAYFGCGLLRSTDGGRTWRRFQLPPVCDLNVCLPRINAIAIDPFSAGSDTSTVVWIATSAGIFRSANSGDDLIRVRAGPADTVVIDRERRGTVYAGVGSLSIAPNTFGGGGVLRTNDDGRSWTDLSAGLATDNIQRIVLVQAPSAPDLLYAAIATLREGFRPDHFVRLYSSADRGQHWQELAPAVSPNAPIPAPTISLPWCRRQCRYDLALAVDPANPAVLYFGGVYLNKSLDGGWTWRGITAGSADGSQIHADVHDIEIDQLGRLWVATDGGVFFSDDQGLRWSSASRTLSLTQFYPGISIAPLGTSTIALGGTQDNGTVLYSGKPGWLQVLQGDGGATAIDPSDWRVLYGELQWQAGLGGPRKSTDAGQSFRLSVQGIDLNEDGIFLPPMVMSPKDPRRLLFGVASLYLSEDGAGTWRPVLSGDRPVRTLAFSARGETAYAATTGGQVFASLDGGGTWTDKTGETLRIVADFAVDPASPRRVYTAGQRVYRLAENGAWADLTANLPEIFAQAITIVTCKGSRRIFLGTDVGVFVSTNDGRSWSPAQRGLPSASAVMDLRVDPAGKTLWAGTYGRGMFVLDLGCRR